MHALLLLLLLLLLCRIFIRYAIPAAPTPLQDTLKHFIIIGIIITITIIFTRDYDKNPSRDTILWHSRLEKNGMYTHRVNKFKFSLASYSIIRNVLFEQSWHLLNRYFILHVQSKGSKLLCRTRSI